MLQSRISRQFMHQISTCTISCQSKTKCSSATDQVSQMPRARGNLFGQFPLLRNSISFGTAYVLSTGFEHFAIGDKLGLNVQPHTFSTNTNGNSHLQIYDGKYSSSSLSLATVPTQPSGKKETFPRCALPNPFLPNIDLVTSVSTIKIFSFFPFAGVCRARLVSHVKLMLKTYE